MMNIMKPKQKRIYGKLPNLQWHSSILIGCICQQGTGCIVLCWLFYFLSLFQHHCFYYGGCRHLAYNCLVARYISSICPILTVHTLFDLFGPYLISSTNYVWSEKCLATCAIPYVPCCHDNSWHACKKHACVIFSLDLDQYSAVK